MDKKFIYIAGGGLVITIILIIILVVLSQKPKTKTVAKTKVLTIWDYKDEKAAYDPVISNFQTENNIKVNYVVKSPSSYLSDTVDAIAAGNGPDVWIVPNDVMPQYHDKMVPMPKGLLANSEQKKDDLEVFNDTYPKVVVGDNVFNNQIYGTPIAIDTLKLFMNSSLAFQALQDYRLKNPNANTDQIQNLLSYGPKNWDDFVQIVRFFSPKTNSKFTFSTVALGTTDNISTYNDLLSIIMMQNGAKMTSDDLGTALFNTSTNLFGTVGYPGTKALSFYTSFADPKSPNYSWNSSMESDVRVLAEGKTSMIFGYNSTLKAVHNITPNLSIQTFDIPQVKETANPINFARYTTLTVAKSSANTNLAWKFISEATGNNFSGAYLSISNQDTAKISNYSSDNSVLTAQNWYNPDTIKVKQILKSAIDQVVTGGDAQTAMDGAAGQITTLLGKLKQSQTQ